jgi:anti-anti-sigma regulatory factor
MTASHTNWSEVEQAAEALVRGALEQVSRGEREVMVDFSGVRRIGAAGLRAVEDLAAQAKESSAKVVLRGVNAEVYKALKLAAVAGEFGFATPGH